MKKTERISYEVDPHNRLIVSGRGSSSPAPARFRTAADGVFRIENGSTLTYHVKKSQDSNIPQKVKFSGNWSFDKDHNLVLTLDKWNEGCYGDKLIIKAGLLSAGGGSLSFAVATRDSGGKDRIYTLAFKGAWQADKFNNIAFRIEKENSKQDELLFQGAWELNGNNRLIYTYTKRGLKRGDKREQSFALKGCWDISKKNRVIYVINKRIGSELEFRVSFAEPLSRGLKYAIGIGARPAKKKMTLFGSWKINKGLGIVFEMPCEGGRVRTIVFGADLKLGRGAEIRARLRDDLGRDLGMSVKLSKKLFGNNGEAYIEALKSAREVSVVAGAGFRW